jgi:ribonuclease P protein component
MKLGRKATSKHLVIYLNSGSELAHPRFGFVVAKTVGSAVQRNLVKRRARAAIRERLESFEAGQDLVIRALPGLAELNWLDFCTELDSSLTKIQSK